ncbi:MAG: hypothetical protein AW11_03416 [Candidatus Accumulibacter regalis]|jgi:hypothetical protein|uniref:Bacteriophage tail tape measure C-terminal domain-containing protein n=1 Tax=Accumulibacter regalis TaxID=522306 RepID=A0A011NS98_ACCRE|nr:hypothetical protein [Accumulibacter sp.]EXI85588.1 MAG: hypothetical protein AW11_03416 [Candidatus Accumulibacter regalis]HRE72614.1 hypothetical protein [Accumulibacter sp.]
MTEDEKIQVAIEAKDGQLKAGMESAAKTVEDNSRRMREAMERASTESKASAEKMHSGINDQMEKTAKSVDGVKNSLIGMTAVVAGAGTFALLAKETADYTEAAITLGRAMNITATQAGIWVEVAHELGSTTAEVQSAANGLTRRLVENEEKLNKVGLTTRDANGHLIDMNTLMKSAIETVNSYKEGTSRNAAAQEIFGGAVAGNSKLLLANAEAFAEDEAYIRSLGGQVSGDAIDAWTIYDSAMDKVGMGMIAMRNTIGNELIPVMAKLGEWLASAMPTAITVAKGAVGGLVSAFWALKNGVVVVWETINAMVVSVAEPIRAVAEAVGRAVAGDFAGAAAAIGGIGGVISGAWSAAMGEMVTSSEETAKRIGQIFGQHADVEKGPEEGKDFVKEKDAKKGAAHSRMPAWESALSEAKVYYQTTHNLREFSKQQEVAYWSDILRTQDVSGKERIAITKKIADLELQIMKKRAADQRALDSEAINAREKVGRDGLQMEELLAQRELQIGNINQAEMLELQRQYEDRRFLIQTEAQAARIAAMSSDPNMDPVALQRLLDTMEEMHREHALKVTKISNDMAIENVRSWQQLLDPVSSAFEKSVNGMIAGTTTMQKAIGGILDSILAEFISMTVKMGVKWAAMELAKTMETQKGSVMRSILEKMGFVETAAAAAASSATKATSKAAEAAVVVPAEAAEAAGGAASSVASIPIVGPGMAAAAFAATMAMVMGGLKSAAGGYDIPAGVNPMTQLHAREMVLPEEHADTIRSMGSDGGAMAVHIHTTDAQGMERLLRNNGRTLAKVMREQMRNFNQG